MGEQGHRHRRDEADRREILARIHAELGVEARVDRQRPGVAEQQRVAVRRGARDRARADGAPAAAAVVDGHGLAESVGQLLRHHARHGIDAAAGRVRHDQRDGARRKISGTGGRHKRGACERNGRCHGDRGDRHQVATRQFIHAMTPSCRRRRHAQVKNTSILWRSGRLIHGWIIVTA